VARAPPGKFNFSRSQNGYPSDLSDHPSSALFGAYCLGHPRASARCRCILTTALAPTMAIPRALDMARDVQAGSLVTSRSTNSPRNRQLAHHPLLRRAQPVPIQHLWRDRSHCSPGYTTALAPTMAIPRALDMARDVQAGSLVTSRSTNSAPWFLVIIHSQNGYPSDLSDHPSSALFGAYCLGHPRACGPCTAGEIQLLSFSFLPSA
jgi:hypothetical protein